LARDGKTEKGIMEELARGIVMGCGRPNTVTACDIGVKTKPKPGFTLQIMIGMI
jgi:hypothetical protein